MFHENFKTLRKDRGFSQEQLALRLNVVRQTISKWEQGLSVPDAEMLMEIAEVLNVQVSDLLGQEIKVEEKDKTAEKIAIELEKLNELLVIQQQKKEHFRKKIIGTISTTIAIVLFVIIVAAIYDSWGEMCYEFGRNLYHVFN